jgi:DNA repair photolyase
MKIISASRREDMPAFRMDYLLEKYHKYGDDHFWVLWTKNPKNIIGAGLDYKRVSLQITITGLGATELEPGVPESDIVCQDLAVLINEGLNPKLINLRIDPLIPGHTKRQMIYNIAGNLKDLGITRCTTSFISWYGHVKERWPEGQETQISNDKQLAMVKDMRDILSNYGMELYGCVQPYLSDIIKPSACIDGQYYSEVTGFEFDTNKDPHQRIDCNCTLSVDIGSYRYCPHNCIYCYSKKV